MRWEGLSEVQAIVATLLICTERAHGREKGAAGAVKQKKAFNLVALRSSGKEGYMGGRVGARRTDQIFWYQDLLRMAGVRARTNKSYIRT